MDIEYPTQGEEIVFRKNDGSHFVLVENYKPEICPREYSVNIWTFFHDDIDGSSPSDIHHGYKIFLDKNTGNIKFEKDHDDDEEFVAGVLTALWDTLVTNGTWTKEEIDDNLYAEAMDYNDFVNGNMSHCTIAEGESENDYETIEEMDVFNWRMPLVNAVAHVTGDDEDIESFMREYTVSKHK